MTARPDAPRDAEEKLLDRFRDPKDPLKILIVGVRGSAPGVCVAAS